MQMKVIPLSLTISHFHVFVVFVDCNKLKKYAWGFFPSGIKLVQSILKILEMGEEFIRADTHTHIHRHRQYDDLDFFFFQERK